MSTPSTRMVGEPGNRWLAATVGSVASMMRMTAPGAWTDTRIHGHLTGSRMVRAVLEPQQLDGWPLGSAEGGGRHGGLSSHPDGRAFQERDPLLRERKPDRWRPPAEQASGPQLWIRAAQYIEQPSIRVHEHALDGSQLDVAAFAHLL